MVQEIKRTNTIGRRTNLINPTSNIVINYGGSWPTHDPPFQRIAMRKMVSSSAKAYKLEIKTEGRKTQRKTLRPTSSNAAPSWPCLEVILIFILRRGIGCSKMLSDDGDIRLSLVVTCCSGKSCANCIDHFWYAVLSPHFRRFWYLLGKRWIGCCDIGDWRWSEQYEHDPGRGCWGWNFRRGRPSGRQFLRSFNCPGIVFLTSFDYITELLGYPCATM